MTVRYSCVRCGATTYFADHPDTFQCRCGSDDAIAVEEPDLQPVQVAALALLPLLIKVSDDLRGSAYRASRLRDRIYAVIDEIADVGESVAAYQRVWAGGDQEVRRAIVSVVDELNRKTIAT